MTISLEHIVPEDWAAVERMRNTLQSLVVDTGGRSVCIRFGTGVWTWPGASTTSGTTTVTHGLGKTPVVAKAWLMQNTGAGDIFGEPESFTLTSTTFQTHARFSTFTPAVGATLTFGWLVIG